MPLSTEKPSPGADSSQGCDEKRRVSRRQQEKAQQQQHARTPHGFHERRTVGQMMAEDGDSGGVGVSPGLLSDALLLRAMGTKQVHHIPRSSESSTDGGDGSRPTTFHSLPPPPLVSGNEGKKRSSPLKSNKEGGSQGQGRSVRQRRALPTAAHRSASSSSGSAGKKNKKKKLPTHRLCVQSKSKDPKDPKFDAAAALANLASSSDSESSASDGPRDWSRGGNNNNNNKNASTSSSSGGKTREKRKKSKKDPSSSQSSSSPNDKPEPMLHGVIPISSLNETRGPMLVDHSYTDYSIVDPDSLRVLDEDQGLSPGGFEWEGLNEDPHITIKSSSSTGLGGKADAAGGDMAGDKYADAKEDEDEEDAAAAAAAAEEHMKGPEFDKEKAKTIKKLRKLFKGIRPSRRNSGGVVQPFPGKLMEVLDREDIEDILSWMPHGRSFVVKQPKVFTADVLPRFFKQSKYMSFTRQLNLWGFKRITRGPDAGAYYHELFLRGRPRLTLRMRRQKIKGTGIKLTPNPDAEPDFYEMAKLRPLPQPRVGAGSKLKPMPPVIRLGTLAKSITTSSADDEVVKDAKSTNGGGVAPFFSSTKVEEVESSSSSSSSAAKPGRSASPDGQDGPAAEAPARSRTYSEDTTGSRQEKSASKSSSTGGVDQALLAAEVLRQREIAAAELLLGARTESPLEALLRLQAAELKQKQEAVLASQGLLRQLDGIIPGTPTTPANTVAELQQRLLAAARALDQPAVQAAVMEEQRRSRLAALLASSGPRPLSSLLAGGIGSDLGLLSRLTTSDTSTLELLKMRGNLGGLGASTTSATTGTGADGVASTESLLGLADALEAQNAKEEKQIASALQQYAAASLPSSPAIVAAAPVSPTVSSLRLGGSPNATEAEVLKAMSGMRN